MTIPGFYIPPTVRNKSRFLSISYTQEAKATPQLSQPTLLESPHETSSSTWPWALCSGCSTWLVPRKSLAYSNCLGESKETDPIPEWICWLFVSGRQKSIISAQSKEFIFILHLVVGSNAALYHTILFYKVFRNEEWPHHPLCPKHSHVKARRMSS